MLESFDDHGIRFHHPPDWEIDVSDDGPRTMISAQSAGGPAFALVTLDEDRPAPAEMADEALEAMKEEYPHLEALPAIEEIGGHKAVGYDVEFFSLDILNGCAIRAYRTPRRTILVFAQWAEIDDGEDDGPESALKALRGSLEETDG
jgi:hypothetical protein